MLRPSARDPARSSACATDDNLMMKIKPTKTEDNTEVEISYDLSMCPMVMEELVHFPMEARNGPIIINPKTNLPPGMCCRDFRAGGITEAVTLTPVQMIAGRLPAMPK